LVVVDIGVAAEATGRIELRGLDRRNGHSMQQLLNHRRMPVNFASEFLSFFGFAVISFTSSRFALKLRGYLGLLVLRRADMRHDRAASISAFVALRLQPMHRQQYQNFATS
jgi:hypothetical protein